MSSIQDLQLKCSTAISELFNKYQDNDYMLHRIHTHIVNYLPNALENELKNHEKRQIRTNFLTNEQQIFIQVFLSKNQYFYLSSTNMFYEYNGKNYFIVKDDDIIHKLLSSISKDRVLLQWKHKTKLNILKQIKDRNLFDSIPESETIQTILNSLYPSFFSCKNSAKYFLTIIGDNILKKNSNLIYLVSSQMKRFLNELDNVAVGSIGNANATHNFMSKYHESHSYENCRLIKMNDHYSNDVWREILKRIGLDLLCVAVHYSKRYETADKFIDNKSDEELANYSYYLKNTSPKNIILEFCHKYIIQTANDIKMEWRNLHFLWKQFFSNCNLPSVIYSNVLKNMFKDLYKYDEKMDYFIGITSKYLPIESNFIKFWESTINVLSIEQDNSNNNDTNNTGNNNNNINNNTFEHDLEIDEICTLFKVWSKQNSEQTINSSNNISEENVLKILKHFFSNVDIIEDKYLLNVTCCIWDKTGDILKSFGFIKEQIKKDGKLQLISFDDAYNYYYKYCNSNSNNSNTNNSNSNSNNNNKLVVSKRYFEKYLYYKIPEYIVYEKFIETSWLL
jgi:hypothetical protein